jgi:hypothetical protein
MSDVVFKVYQVFYTKSPSKRRAGLWVMIKWCIKEYIATFKKEEIQVNVMTDEITNIHN